MNIYKYILFSVSFFIAAQALSQEYFVRPDGGTLEQCNGTVNQAYSETIIDQACAVRHIFELLDPETKTAHISGGDIVNILNNEDGTAAEYALGRHGDYTGGGCNENWPWDCYMPSLPAGTASNPTIIRGGMADLCETKPILWGTARAKRLFSLDNTQHITMSCLTITDRESCIGASGYPDTSLICDRSPPHDQHFADIGLFMRDSSNITLADVDIQGLSVGIKAGRVADVYLTRVNIFANFGAGWDGDLADGHSSSNSGTISFVDSDISFNGCGLIYNPEGDNHLEPHACARQDIGGYGDGLGTGETGGDWIFENVRVMHNNSDGIDLLYHSLGGKVTVKNSRFEGNAGNQLKVAGDSDIVNNLIIGNCAWSSRQEHALGGEGENCRALGTPLSLSYTHADTAVNLINNTIYSEGDCLLSGGDRTNIGPFRQKLTVVNNAFYGLIDYLQSFENTCLYYTDEPFPVTQIHNNIIHKVKPYDNPCTNFQGDVPAGEFGSICTTSVGPYYDNDDYSVVSNPKLNEINLGHRYSAYDPQTISLEASMPYPVDETSIMINSGYAGDDLNLLIPTEDFYGEPRAGKPDIGAIEFQFKPKAPAILSIEPI